MNELLDDDGENRAVRAFLMHYGAGGLTVGRQALNMRYAGWRGLWPEWVEEDSNEHLTKAGAQLWLRHLFALESVPESQTHFPAGVAAVPPTKDRGVTVDRTGLTCRTCGNGTYQETSATDDMDGVLHCTTCREEVARHGAPL